MMAAPSTVTVVIKIGGADLMIITNAVEIAEGVRGIGIYGTLEVGC